jgi:hypothetical protein
MATDPNLLAGIASLNIDGANRLISGGAKYQVSGLEKETLTGQDVVHGYKAKPRPGKIWMTLRDTGDLSISDLQAITNSTIVLELANGKTIVGRGMWCVGSQEVDTEEGTFDAEFESKSVVEA